MSSDTVISVENLGKKYQISHQQTGRRYTALRDVLADRTKSVARRLWSALRPSALRPSALRPPTSACPPSDLRSPTSGCPPSESFWALKDVSFEVKQGEVLGIIGRNGAGKSTLLKILSRITEPTEGRVRIKGRVASLLEVGTGFHPELTGRENIFLNGAILGMHRAEIKRKFDEIVAFAEIEKFLDTPVKRYSSGMYVRLAFAVAAHLEPEILIVDEVLAVGDAEFQKKCLGKMQDVSKGGRTVLFVSHNEAAIRRLCSTAILLHDGAIEATGSPQEIFQKYNSATHSRFSAANRTVSSNVARIEDAVILVDGIISSNVLPLTNPVITLRVHAIAHTVCSFEILMRDASSSPIMFSRAGLDQGFVCSLSPGRHVVSFHIKLPYLAEGQYYLDLMIVEPGIRFFDYLERAISFNALPGRAPFSGWVFKQARGQGCVLFDSTIPKITCHEPER